MFFEELTYNKFAFIYGATIDEKLPHLMKCGMAVFRGGLSSAIPLKSEKGQTITIEVPEDVIKSSTWETYMSPFDDVEIKVISNDI